MGFVYLILVLVLPPIASTARDLTTGIRGVVPYPVDETFVFNGTGGCAQHWRHYQIPCIMALRAGDFQSRCIPTADGGHRCVCSSAYQIYSDGICKPKDLCNYTSIGFTGDSYRTCRDSGGVCKIDTTTNRGYTCDCTGTGNYTSLRSPYYQCVADPCTSTATYQTSCKADGGVCVPQNAVGGKPQPYTCKCPGTLLFMDSDPEYIGSDCKDPCAVPTKGCEKCAPDVTKPYGTDCTCTDPNQVFFYGLGCSDPCTGAPNNSTFYRITPVLNGTSVGFGADACRRDDKGATCYTTEKSPLYYQCNCSVGYANTFIYRGNGTTFQGMERGDFLITCVDVDECAIPKPCGEDVNATCINLPGSFECQCTPNYYTYQKKCVWNPCTAPNACGSDPAAVCTSVAGGKTCNCSSGYAPLGDICVKDYCATPSICGKFDPAPVCTNTNNSYICNCSVDFIFNGTECIKKPPTVDTACAKADPKDGNPCNNQGDKNATCSSVCSTTYACNCSIGFRSNRGVCEDANECEFMVNPCPTLGCGIRNDTICRNTIGSLACSCGTGATCPCGVRAECIKKSDRLMKCKCGKDIYYYY